MTKRNPYDVLGVNASIGKDELKSHYHRLVVENHPDKLIARGVPKEFVAIATEKLAATTWPMPRLQTNGWTWPTNLMLPGDDALVLIDFHLPG